LILREPLDQIEANEARRIMKFLTAPERPWGLVVASQNEDWAANCSQIMKLDDGKLIRKK
jgi:ABC-type transport system involved in cytochrome bd biosynthesis fused ATPase/permease subunit